MKKTALYLFLSVIFILPLRAQQPVVLGEMTMERAVAAARENSSRLKIWDLKEQQDEYRLQEIRTRRLPDVNLSADLRHNLIIPGTPIPATMLHPEANPDDVLYMKFSTRWTSIAGADLTYDLFNPATHRQVAEQKQLQKINSYNARIEASQLEYDTRQAYAEAVIVSEQYRSLEQDTALYHGTFAEALTLYGKEKISLAEKNTAEMAYNASLNRLSQADNLMRLARIRLLHLMGIEVTEANVAALSFAESTEELYTRMETMQAAESNVPSLNIAMQEEVIALASDRSRNAALKYYPSLSLNGFYGSNYYSNTFDLFKSAQWHGNSYIALGLRVPITRSLATGKEIRQLNLQEQIERETLRDLQNERLKAFTEAEAELQVYRGQYLASLKNRELSRQNLTAAQALYEKGYIPEKDLLAEQLAYRNAYQAYLQTAYDVFSSYLRLQRSREQN